jgi:hypothetical protein
MLVSLVQSWDLQNLLTLTRFLITVFGVELRRSVLQGATRLTSGNVAHLHLLIAYRHIKSSAATSLITPLAVPRTRLSRSWEDSSRRY